ncbi:MAG: SRPBCC family protein [Chitinophagaceae bacterium]
MVQNEQYGSWHADNEFQPEGGSNVINVSNNERIVSAAVGAFLLSSGLNNLFSSPLSGLVKTALGGVLLYRGASGHCPVYSSMGKTKNVSQTSAINIRTSLVVNKPKDEVYAFWRKLENLPLFMKHLASVTEIDSKHSHWEAVIPGNIGKIKWNAEIVKEEPGYLIGWQSIPNSMINNAGKVMFHDAMGGQGTELEVVISYHPPAGELGSGAAKLLNPVFEKLIRQDVMNFKEYIETKHKSSGSTGSSFASAGSSSTGGTTGGSQGSSSAAGGQQGNQFSGG